MMSDSDDTDVLLLIPPDLFLVPPSSDSDSDSDCVKHSYNSGRTGVISELVEHMQTLDSRITAIESKDNSLDATLLNNSLDLQVQSSLTGKFRQTLPRTRFSVSQNSSLQNTPIKLHQSLSVPSTPSGYSASNCTNFHQNEMKSSHHFPVAKETNTININGHDRNQHDLLVPYFDSSVVPCIASHSGGLPHVNIVSSKREPCSHPADYHRNASNPYVKSSDQLHSISSTSTLLSTTGQPHLYCKSRVQEMELSEVDELLQEMEATELELSKRINSVSSHQYFKDQNSILPPNTIDDSVNNGEEEASSKYSISRKLEFQSCKPRLQFYDLPTFYEKKSTDVFPDISLPYNDSYQLDETGRMISEFKTWEPNVQKPVSKVTENTVEATNLVKSTDNSCDKPVTHANDVRTKESMIGQSISNTDNFNTQCPIYVHNTQSRSVHKSADIEPPNELTKHNVAMASDVCKNSQQNSNLQRVKEPREFSRCTAHASTNTDYLPRKSQRLLSLSDFWDNNTNKSQDEMLRIKLEEEKFRREHCEHLIQELQKRLLEQQEKVAVAVRVDNEKNDLIAQFQSAWSKLKQRVNILETEHKTLQSTQKSLTEKHQSEIQESQLQMKRFEGELSKALDLAAGYKEKSDGLIKEKVDLLKIHADELESYKSLVQEAENRYEELKGEYNKLSEKNQQTEEAFKNLQQELGRERLKGGEVRNEMNVIHKALDTCETELTILKQEKENLQLKLKEEINRNAILEQKNSGLLLSIDDARKAEKLAKDETKSLAEEKEKIRSELQEVYQKQVDEVVKTKLQEFQMQLDAAESEFMEELKTRQQVIAECAARKIKDVMDKHRLEINLLEEKHKEEKRLCGLQLAQAAQKSSILETQLNSQRATKSQLAEQLHSVMQKQWQQALQIISGGNLENLTPLQRIHAEKLFESKGPRKSESMPNCYAKISQEPMRLISQLPDGKNFNMEDQNESRSTMTPIEDTPLTSRKEGKDDLRKYIKMIAEMQQSREEFAKIRESASSPPLVCREVPRKHYMKKELSIMSEDSITWQPVSETSTHDVYNEYIPVSQKILGKTDQQRNKPPWK